MIDELKKLQKDLGKQIHIERIKAEISQEDLAEFAGISVATFSKLERGLVLPTVETSFRLAKALNMTMSELFTFNF